MRGHRFPEEFNSMVHHRYDWGDMLLTTALITLAVAAVAWIVVMIVRTSRASQPALAGVAPVAAATSRVDDALAVLRMRYARGEISRADYVQASVDLGEMPPPPSFRASAQPDPAPGSDEPQA